MSQTGVGRESDKFMLRFPHGMRDELKEEAAQNGRSLNAEIVHRLSQYRPLTEELESYKRDLKHTDIAAVRLRDQLAAARLELDRTKDALHDALKGQPPSMMKAPIDKLLYVVLDANGLPVGWSEMMAHLEGLVQAAGGTFEKVEALMLNSKNPQNADLDKVAWVLERYKEKKFGMQGLGEKPSEKVED